MNMRSKIRSRIKRLILERLIREEFEMVRLKKKMEKYPFVLQQLLDGYGDVPPIDITKGKAFSNKLSDFFLENPTKEQFNEIIKYYDAYMKLSKKHKKFTKMGDDGVEKTGDILFNKHFVPNFEVFRSNVDRLAKKNGIELEDFNRDIEDNDLDFGGKAQIDVGNRTVNVCGKDIDKKDITYPDVNDSEFEEKAKKVVIVRANSPKDSNRYGNGFCEVGHEWCTVGDPSSNLFYDYRFGVHGRIGLQTMYFVYFPERYAKELESESGTRDEEAVIHFGMSEDRRISYTDRTNAESTKDLNFLKKFEELKDVDFDKAFTFVEISGKETLVHNMSSTISLEHFKTLDKDTIIAWILAKAVNVSFDQWKLMDKDTKNIWLIKSETAKFRNLDVNILLSLLNTSAGKRILLKLESLDGYFDQTISSINRYILLSKIIELNPAAFSDENTFGRNSLSYRYFYQFDETVSIDKKIELSLKILNVRSLFRISFEKASNK